MTVLLAIRFNPTLLASLSRAGRDFLLRTLPPHGVLVATNEEIRQIRSVLCDIAPGEWQRWQEMLIAVPKHNASVISEHIADISPMLRLPTLFVVDDDAAARLRQELGEASNGEPFMVTGHSQPCEVAPGDAVASSALLNERRLWSNSSLQSGSSREAVWDRLNPVLRHSTHIVLTDRYLLEHGASLVTDPTKSNGLSWLLDRMASTPELSAARVEVFAHTPPPPHDVFGQVERIADQLHHRLGQRVASVTVHAIERKFFDPLVHSRTIRTSGTRMNRMFTIDHSLSAFDQTHLTQPVAFSYRQILGHELSSVQALEDRLRLLCRDGVGPVSRA